MFQISGHIYMVTDRKMRVIKSFASLRSFKSSWVHSFLQSFKNCVGYPTFLEHHTEDRQIYPLVTGKVDTYTMVLDSINPGDHVSLSRSSQQSQLHLQLLVVRQVHFHDISCIWCSSYSFQDRTGQAMVVSY